MEELLLHMLWWGNAMSVGDRISKDNVPTSRNITHWSFHHVDMKNIDGAYQNSQLVLKSPRVGIALNI